MIPENAQITPAWHFVGERLHNGDPVPSDGEWLEYRGVLPLIPCERGLHACVHPMDALKYAPGSTLCRVELAGEVQCDTDKLVATRRRIVARRDMEQMLLRFARRCALDVADLWPCPSNVKEYLETGSNSTRAAPAWVAARAAREAVGGKAKYRRWFLDMVVVEFGADNGT